MEEILRIVIGLVLIISFVAFNALILVYVERKVAGHIQRRPGPMEVGPHGILQTLVDGLKLMGKQLVFPKAADKPFYMLAPVLAFAIPVAVFIVIPFSEKLQARDINVGLLLILALSSFNVLAILMAGWSSNNKYSLLGAARSVAQGIAYEVPMLLIVLSIVLMTNSLKMGDIVRSQGTYPWQWNILYQPLAFLVYFICTVAETNRNPFDLPEAESELTGGFHTEYSSMGFGLFFMAEYANMVMVSSIATVLFLGGWNGPTLPWMPISGAIWFLMKLYPLIFIVIWFRWTFPRVRFDQLLNFSWKLLIPISILNLIVTAVVLKI